ncbi:MAG: pseudouridine synthase [Balneolales bacterium]
MSKKKQYHRPQRKFWYKIVHQDRDLIVVDKPAGLLTVPIPRIKSINLLDMLNRDCSGGGNIEIQTVHRIDRYTSGLVVFAKNKATHYDLVKQFKARTPERIYLALVRGKMQPETGVLEHSMKRIDQGFRNIIVPEKDPTGSPARMEYKVMEQYADTCLVRIRLDSGLKNQIRVQFAEVGNPMVGDRHYARKEMDEPLIDRQALHAAELGFVHPAKGSPVLYKAKMPDDMKELVKFYKAKTG